MPSWLEFGWIVGGSVIIGVITGVAWACIVDAFYRMEQAEQAERNDEFSITLTTLPGVEAYYIPPDRVPVIHHVYINSVRLFPSQVEVASLRGMYNYRSRPGFFSIQDRFIHLFPVPDGNYSMIVRGAPSPNFFYGYDSGWNSALQRTTEEKIEKSINLMLDWLTPAQRKMLLEKKYFEVVGNDSKRIYRINPGMTFNVHELNKEGQPAAKLCFQPDNAPYLGDVLLAQKLTLETNELMAISVANRQQNFYDHDFGGAVYADFNEQIARCWEKKKKRKPKVDKVSKLP